MVDSHGRRRRRAVDGEQLLAFGAAAVAKARGEARAKARRAKEDGVGRAAVVIIVVAAPAPMADLSALELVGNLLGYLTRHGNNDPGQNASAPAQSVCTPAPHHVSSVVLANAAHAAA